MSIQDEYSGSEKRAHPRKSFSADKRPTIQIGLQEFEVIDISEKGIRFVNDKKILQTGWVNGTINFPGRVSVDVDGVIVREDGGNMGLHLVGSLDPDIVS